MNADTLHREAAKRIELYGERIGQAYWNAAYDLDPEAVREITMTEADCFHPRHPPRSIPHRIAVRSAVIVIHLKFNSDERGNLR